MIQTIQLIKFLYPFILLAVFFCLYKKEYSIMKRFCWRMTMTFSARKLFIIVVLSSLIFMNWCCYMTDPNWAVAFAAFMTCVFSLTEWLTVCFTGCMRESAFGLLHSCLPWYVIPYLT